MVKLQRHDTRMLGKIFSAAFDRLLGQENWSCFSHVTKRLKMVTAGLVV